MKIPPLTALWVVCLYVPILMITESLTELKGVELFAITLILDAIISVFFGYIENINENIERIANKK